MNNYVATFYSHYDALMYFTFLQEQGVEAKLAPVPRKVSASCGTCVLFFAKNLEGLIAGEIEAIYLQADSKVTLVWADE